MTVNGVQKGVFKHRHMNLELHLSFCCEGRHQLDLL